MCPAFTGVEGLGCWGTRAGEAVRSSCDLRGPSPARLQMRFGAAGRDSFRRACGELRVDCHWVRPLVPALVLLLVRAAVHAPGLLPCLWEAAPGWHATYDLPEARDQSGG